MIGPWGLVLLAGLLECAWALGLKWSDGFSRLGPSVFTVVTALISFFMLSQAMKTLPVGTAYAVWTGVGALGAAVLGVALFGEAATLLRTLGILLIVAGIIALRFAG